MKSKIFDILFGYKIWECRNSKNFQTFVGVDFSPYIIFPYIFSIYMFLFLLIFQHICQASQPTHEILEGTNVLFVLKIQLLSTVLCFLKYS